MPNLSQLPLATVTNATDQVLLQQPTQTATVTVEALLANTQPKLTLATGVLLGRASILPGEPEPISVGTGLMVQSGTITADSGLLANLASPALTGIPTAPTPPAGDASNAIATTAFVEAHPGSLIAVGDVVGSGNGTVTLTLPAITAAGTFPKVAVNAKGQVVGSAALASSDLAAGLVNADLSTSIVRAQAGISRTLSAIQTDVQNLRNYGAVGDGVADDSAPVTALNAVGGGFVPAGHYKTTLDLSVVDGPFHGPGVLVDKGGFQRAPMLSNIMQAPSGAPNANDISTAFNGDFSHVTLAFEHRIADTAGGHTIGTPASNSYLYNPQTAAIYGYVHNTSGTNGTTGDNSSRTGAVASRLKVDNYGQGDLVAYNASGYVASILPGATHFLANPAIGLFGGDVEAGISGAYLNPFELSLNDQGFDVAAIGAVVNLNRTNATGALGATWIGYRSQSDGSKPADAHFSATGTSRIGLDLVGAISPVKAAVAIKANDRIYLNSTNSDSHQFPNSVIEGTEWLEYDPLNGPQFVVSGVPVANFAAGRATLAQSPALSDSSTAIATTAFVQGQSYVHAAHISNYPAMAFGGVWDGLHDVSAAITAAIIAATAAGGGRVVLPAGRYPIATPLRISTSLVSLVSEAGDLGTSWDDATFAGTFPTTLFWTGPVGAAMLTLSPVPSVTTGKPINGINVLGILFDCQGTTSGGAGTAVTGGAAYGAAIYSIHNCRISIGFRDATTCGVLLDTVPLNVYNDVQGNEFSIHGTNELSDGDGVVLQATGSGGASNGNVSLNLWRRVFLRVRNGWCLRVITADNNYFDMVATSQVGATAGVGGGVSLGPATGQSQFRYYSGAPVVVNGSVGNNIDSLDTGNGTASPVVTNGGQISWRTSTGVDYNKVFTNQTLLTVAEWEVNIFRATGKLDQNCSVVVVNDNDDQMQLWRADASIGWGIAIDSATNDFRIVRLAGNGGLNLGNGAPVIVGGPLSAPTPSATDSSANVATTAWVASKNYIQQFANMATLRSVSLATLSDGFTVTVAAFAIHGDGGGGIFTWNATSLLPDDNGSVVNAIGNSGGGRWLRQLTNGRVTPQMFGAKGDGLTDDTLAFNAALKAARVTVPAATYLVSGIAMINGAEIEGGAGLGYSGDTSITAVVKPILMAKAGSSCIINVAGVRDISIAGLFLDGGNIGSDGISAGSTQLTLNRVTVVRCTNGLGSAAGADLYTHVPTIIDCEFANCINGVVNLVDGVMMAGAVSACTYGINLGAGAAANNFIGVRAEWCSQHNIHIYQSQKIQFIGGLVDAASTAGAYLAGASDIHFVGVQFARNGRTNDTTWLGNSHLVLDSNNAAIAITNPVWTKGQDDTGSGPVTPQYGITYNNTNDRVVITSGDGGGYTAAFSRGTEPTSYVLRDVSGAGDSIVTAARPYIRDGIAAQTVQTRNSSNMGPGQLSTITVGQSAFSNGYSAYFREMIVYATDFNAGNSYAAKFNLVFYYDTAAHLPTVSSAFGEVGTAGLFSFSTTNGTLQLSIGGLAADGSSFILTIKNVSASGNYGVWAELH